MAVSLVSEFGRWSYPAGGTNLVQFQFVTVNAAGQIVMPTAGQLCVILDDAPALAAGGVQGATVVGVNYGVVWQGIQKVIAGQALIPFAQVTTNSSGQAVSSLTTGQAVNGITMAACNSGDLVPIAISLSGVPHY
jgi:hypothetical protein